MSQLKFHKSYKIFDSYVCIIIEFKGIDKDRLIFNSFTISPLSLCSYTLFRYMYT